MAVWLSALPASAQEIDVPQLARRLGCFACHAAGAEKPAAPLNRIGDHLHRSQLLLALTQPRKLHPGAKMPSYAYLPPAELQALVEFLAQFR